MICDFVRILASYRMFFVEEPLYFSGEQQLLFDRVEEIYNKRLTASDFYSLRTLQRRTGTRNQHTVSKKPTLSFHAKPLRRNRTQVSTKQTAWAPFLLRHVPNTCLPVETRNLFGRESHRSNKHHATCTFFCLHHATTTSAYMMLSLQKEKTIDCVIFPKTWPIATNLPYVREIELETIGR